MLLFFLLCVLAAELPCGLQESQGRGEEEGREAGKALPGPFEDRDVWILREKSSFRDHLRQWHRYTGDLVFKEGTIPSGGISRRNLKTEADTPSGPGGHSQGTVPAAPSQVSLVTG